MMKKFRMALVAIFTLTLMAVTSSCVTPEEEKEENLLFELINDDTEYSVSGAKETLQNEEIVIPRYHNGLPVTEISNRAFRDCEYIKKVTISKGITKVGELAFSNCPNLKSVIIPASLKNISYSAFENDQTIVIYTEATEGQTGLTRSYPTYWGVVANDVKEYDDFQYLIKDKKILITNYFGDAANVIIPSKIHGINVTSIMGYSFEKRENLVSVTFEEGITDIGDFAFYNCVKLKEIVFPTSLTTIGVESFSYCHLLETVVLPEGLLTIDNMAFVSCLRLKNIEIPSSVIKIDERAFRYCSSLESIKIDENNKIYDSRDNCNAIIETATNTLIMGSKNTVIPSNITTIGYGSFSFCDIPKNFVIPSSVTTIEAEAFFRSRGFESVIIPESVTTIGAKAFDIDLDAIIYCEVTKQPDGWASNWCNDEATVVWGYKNID